MQHLKMILRVFGCLVLLLQASGKFSNRYFFVLVSFLLYNYRTSVYSSRYKKARRFAYLAAYLLYTFINYSNTHTCTIYAIWYEDKTVITLIANQTTLMKASITANSMCQLCQCIYMYSYV